MLASTKTITTQETAANAAMDFEIGSVPVAIEILNLDTGAVATWHNGMNDGEIFVLSAGGGAGGTGLKVADGITVISHDSLEDVDLSGGVELPAGFSLGALADFNDNAESLSFKISY